MSIYAVTSVMACLVNLAIGLFVYKKNRESLINKSFLLLSLSLSTWIFGCFMQSVLENRALALIFDKVLYTGVILYPVLFLFFIFNVLEIRKERKVFIPAWIISLGFLLFNYVPLLRNYFIHDVSKKYPFRFIASPGLLWFFLILFEVLVVFYGLFLILGAYKNSRGFKSIQIKYFLIAYFIVTIAGLMYFGLVINIYTPPLDNFLVVVFSSIVAYAIIRYRLMEIEVLIKRALIFTGIYAPIFGLFFVITFYGQRGVYETLQLAGVRSNTWVLVALGAAFVALIIRPLDNFLRRTTDRFLYQKKYDYASILSDAGRGMARITNLDHLLGLIVHILTKKMKLSQAQILLYDKDKKGYYLTSRRFDKNIKVNNGLAEDSNLVTYLNTIKNPVAYEELVFLSKLSEREIKKQGLTLERLNLITKDLEKFEVALAVPSFISERVGEEHLLGILMLGHKKSRDMYNQQDIEMFQALSHEAAIAINNAQQYQNLKNTQAQLLQEEKLATIGRMANAIGHEINNPLSIIFMSIQTLMRELKEKKLSPKEIREKLEMANRHAERINVVVEELTHLFRETERGIRSALDLKGLIKGTVSLVRYQSDVGEGLDNIKLIQDIPGNLPKIKGDTSQLEQVFLNLFTNACHAMGKSGKITISAQISPDDPDKLRIKFSDTGPGIPKELLNKIFDYRFTTREKGKGTGMGLFVCKYVMTLHEGSIAVESKLGEGTTFTLELPIWKEKA